MQSRFDQAVELGVEGARRMSHGGSAWSLPRGTSGLRQPQDGAAMSSAPSLLASLRHGNALLEPEDAGMTGGTRSLTRRLMGLNVTSAPRKSVSGVIPVAQRRIA